MSSSESSSSSSALPADELSKRMFYGGCFGLPWLWIVHAIYWKAKSRGNNDELLVNNQEQNGGGGGENTVEEITRREKKWVSLCRHSAFAATVGWVVWILLVQFILVDKLPSGLYVRSGDQGEYTGW